MIRANFKTHKITKFTPEEVEATGAKLEDVQLRTMVAIQLFRMAIKRRVKLLHNGMTTGVHKAPEHRAGLAVDGSLYPEDGKIDIATIFKGALAAGFKGVGIYWNGLAFSFHLDLRKEYAFWYGEKKAPGVGSWEYKSLFVTP